MARFKRLESTLNFNTLWERYSTVVEIIVLVAVFSIFGENFATVRNFQQLILGNTGLIIVVLGLGVVMTGGGIDLSIGYQISIVSAVISLLSIARVPDWLVILAALAAGLICGLLNGVLVGYLEILPFAATIASQIIFRGISFVLTDGRMVSYIAESVRRITRVRCLGIRLDVLLVLVGFLVLSLVLHNTFCGKELRAVGLNEEAAARAGVNVKLVKGLSYCTAGLFYAVAAMVLVSRRGYAGSEIGVGMEITAIAAAYIGGILSVAETQRIYMLLFGVLVVAITEKGLGNMGMNPSLQYIMTGVILIISMVINKRKKNANR